MSILKLFYYKNLFLKRHLLGNVISCETKENVHGKMKYVGYGEMEKSECVEKCQMEESCLLWRYHNTTRICYLQIFYGTYFSNYYIILIGYL